jgi:hypothetical protein
MSGGVLGWDYYFLFFDFYYYFFKGKHPFEKDDKLSFFQKVENGKHEILNTSHSNDLKELVYQMIHLVFFFYFVLYKTLIYIFFFSLKIFN